MMLVITSVVSKDLKPVRKWCIQPTDLLLQGLDHVMFVAATGNRLLLRQYAIAFKKSGAQVPRAELAEIGPRIDFSIRRSRGAPDEIQTQSMKQPKLDKKKVGSIVCSELT